MNYFCYGLSLYCIYYAVLILSESLHVVGYSFGVELSVGSHVAQMWPI